MGSEIHPSIAAPAPVRHRQTGMIAARLGCVVLPLKELLLWLLRVAEQEWGNIALKPFPCATSAPGTRASSQRFRDPAMPEEVETGQRMANGALAYVASPCSVTSWLGPTWGTGFPGIHTRRWGRPGECDGAWKRARKLRTGATSARVTFGGKSQDIERGFRAVVSRG